MHAVKIKRNPMHPLTSTLLLLYVLESVTRGTLIVHRHSFASPHCRISQYLRTIVSLSVSLWNNLTIVMTVCLMLSDWWV